MTINFAGLQQTDAIIRFGKKERTSIITTVISAIRPEIEPEALSLLNEMADCTSFDVLEYTSELLNPVI